MNEDFVLGAPISERPMARLMDVLIVDDDYKALSHSRSLTKKPHQSRRTVGSYS